MIIGHHIYYIPFKSILDMCGQEGPMANESGPPCSTTICAARDWRSTRRLPAIHVGPVGLPYGLMVEILAS